MNFHTEIPDLEAELHHVLGMCEADERALAKSSTPEVDGIFLASLNKLRHELEKRLHRAKAERRHELQPALRQVVRRDGALSMRPCASLPPCLVATGKGCMSVAARRW